MNRLAQIVLLLFALVVVKTSVWAQAGGSPVAFDGKEVFSLYDRVGSFTANDRALAATQRIEQVASSRVFSTDSIQVSDNDRTTDIVTGDVILVSITDTDAKEAGVSRQEYAKDILDQLKAVIGADIESKRPKMLLIDSALALVITFSFGVILTLFSKTFGVIYSKIAGWENEKIRGMSFKNLELLTAARITRALIVLTKVVRTVLTILLCYFYFPLVFSFFPWTAQLAPKLFDYILDPLHKVGHVFVESIPNFFFVIVIIFVGRFLLKFIHFIFNEIEEGTIQFSGFHQEWAEPTYKLVRVLVLALALVVIFPYLPGSGSPAFQGVSVFLGVLVSFGSSSAIGNMVAGIVITYMRPFKVGDRVKIADTVGDVVEKNLLITRVKTIKNVDVTIPNSMVLSSHIVNFSSSAQDNGLILNTSVTIGYDAPWRKVHELLKNAALQTSQILTDPAPYILQTSLDDFYVSYELNAYTHQSNLMAKIYSELHQNIQDQFNAAGMEIMSPHYASLRDGNKTAIPVENLDEKYKAPGFKFTAI